MLRARRSGALIGADGSDTRLNQIRLLARRLRRKIHYFTVGTTLALGVNLVSQLERSCAMSGQCASCGACVPRLLPILGLPLALDAILTLITKLRNRSTDGEAMARQTVPTISSGAVPNDTPSGDRAPTTEADSKQPGPRSGSGIGAQDSRCPSEVHSRERRVGR